MGRVEDVTLPARFLTTTAHLIATLTIVYDVVRARANALSARGPGPPLRAARASPESLNGNGNVRCAFFELARLSVRATSRRLVSADTRV